MHDPQVCARAGLMLGSFSEAVAGKLADRWAVVVGPAVVFWAGGALAWAFAGSGSARLTEVFDWLNDQQVGGQLAVLLGALVLVGASAVLVQRLTTPALRLMEGYWPAGVKWLRPSLIGRVRRRAEVDAETWRRMKLETEPPTVPTGKQLSELAALERRLQRLPSSPDRLLPTRTGNILRAAESRPADKYGLEAVIVWPRLWLVLPDATRQELSTARASLDASVAAAVWGALFSGFAPLAWWALPVGVAVAVAAVVWWVPSRAEVFADLVEAAYDLHRTSLYQHLRWPLPDNPRLEHGSGERLTNYLWRGSDGTEPVFTPPAQGGGP